MAEPTPEQLRGLLDLQATDTRIRRLERQLDDLPQQREMEASRERAVTLGHERDDIAIELDRARAEQRQLERETDVLAQRRDVERSRLYDGSVTNAREMKSVEAEIEATVHRIDELDERSLVVLERVEELESRAGELVADREAETERSEVLEVERDDAAKGLLAELGELRATRDTQSEGLTEALLERYGAAAGRGGGTGVATLEGNACSACRIELSWADVGELRDGPPLANCPQCRRLLVVDP